jgi:hypothetical protein
MQLIFKGEGDEHIAEASDEPPWHFSICLSGAVAMRSAGNAKALAVP